MSGGSELAKYASKTDLAATLDVIDAALLVGSEVQFRKVMQLVFDVLPIEKADICVARIGSDNSIIRNDRQISIDYPSQWVKVYRDRRFGLVDPVARHLFIRQKPL